MAGPTGYSSSTAIHRASIITKAMPMKLGKIVAWIISAVFITSAVFWYLSQGFGLTVIFLLAAGILTLYNCYKAMPRTLGKIIAWIISAVFFVSALFWLLTQGFGWAVILLLLGGVLFYEFGDYLDFARIKEAREAREQEPCLHCRSSGRIGKKRCPVCRGKGYVVAPEDKFRPPIT